MGTSVPSLKSVTVRRKEPRVTGPHRASRTHSCIVWCGYYCGILIKGNNGTTIFLFYIVNIALLSSCKVRGRYNLVV